MKLPIVFPDPCPQGWICRNAFDRSSFRIEVFGFFYVTAKNIGDVVLGEILIDFMGNFPIDSDPTPFFEGFTYFSRMTDIFVSDFYQ